MTTQFQFRGQTYALATNGQLTEKEEVEAVQILLGLTYKESAKQRGVSPETVKRQRAIAKSKVAARSQYEFVMACVAHGWLSATEAVFSLGRRIKAVLAPPCVSSLDIQFHHAQARLRARNRTIQATAPAPKQPDLTFFDLSTAQRQHLTQLNESNSVRYVRFLGALQQRLEGASV